MCEARFRNKVFHLYLVGAVYYEHIVFILHFEHGFLRDDHGAVHPGGKEHFTAGAMFQELGRVGEAGAEGDRAGVGFKFPFYGFYFTGFMVICSVCQYQPYFPVAAVAFGERFGVLQVFCFRYVELGIYIACIRYRSKQGAFIDEASDL